MSEDFSPVLRTVVGVNPNPDETGAVNRPDEAFVRLGWLPRQNQAATAAAGKPIFDNVLTLRHVYPGTKDEADFALKLVRDGQEHILDVGRCEKFAAIIKRFETDNAAAAAGTPLSAILLPPGQVATLNGQNVHSVEALASVPDSVLDKLGGGAYTAREKARNFIEAIEGGAPVARLEADKERMQAELDDLRRQVGDLVQQRREAQADALTGVKARLQDAEAPASKKVR